MPRLLCSLRQGQLHQALFDLCEQCGFAHPGWTEDEDQRGSGRLTQRIPDGLIGLFERWMSDRVRLEVVQPDLGWLMDKLAGKRNGNTLLTHQRYSS